MSWLSKTIKKAARSVKKHLGKHWWVPGYNIVKGGLETGDNFFKEIGAGSGTYEIEYPSYLYMFQGNLCF